jgi:hypothetical protein
MVIKSVTENKRWESDQARVMEMRRSGCETVDAFVGCASCMNNGMSMLVASAKMEKIKLASEPRRIASSIITACLAAEVVVSRSGAASCLR